eukprot:9230025-Pyramimonas_sp.AAC.1
MLSALFRLASAPLWMLSALFRLASAPRRMLSFAGPFRTILRVKAERTLIGTALDIVLVPLPS